jgi:hypothetical protein
MATKFNPLGKMQKETPTDQDEGSVVDPQQESAFTGQPKKLTPEQLRQRPQELLGDEHADDSAVE